MITNNQPPVAGPFRAIRGLPVRPLTAPTAAELRDHALAELQKEGILQEHHPMMAELYRRAETRLRKRSENPKSKARDPKPDAAPQRLLHELQVHQVELEMQNAELHESRDRTEALLEKYTDLYDFAPVGYFSLDEHGRILEANLTGAVLLGVERSRLVGQSLRPLVSPELLPVFNSFLKRVFASQTKQSCDFELLSKDKPPRTVNIEARRMLNGPECRAVLMDITARRRGEDEVRVSEIRYRRLFEAAHDGVLILDPETRKITDANPFMTRLLGYTHNQLVGKELFEIGLLKDRVASQEMFRRLKRKHEVRYEDLPLESQRGRHQEVEVVANLYSENGLAVIQCNVRDITERKTAEEMLRRNEALFSALINQAPVGVYVVDDRLRLQQVNPKARPVFRRIQPLIGRNLSEILRRLWPRKTAGHILHRFQHTLLSGKPYYSHNFSEKRRDLGVMESYDWQLQRIALPAGHHGVVCFFDNTTERKRMEATQRRLEVLAASNRKLEREIVRRQAVEESLKKSEQHQSQLLVQSRQMQEQLRRLSRQILSVQEEERREISRELHDVIAQTLTGINVRLSALKKEAALDTKDLDRNIAKTQRLVEKSVDIVHRFARELRPTVLDDLGLIPALHSFMKSFTTRTGVRICLKAFAGIEQLDSNKRTVLFRVAQEALTNVARHAHASRVEVILQKRPDSIRMKIKDDGRSFQLNRVLHSNGHQRLGLLGMQERLEMLGGRFGVESAPGKGTTITAQIPLGKAGGLVRRGGMESVDIKS